MAEFSNTLENWVIDHFFGEGARDQASPLSLQVALYSAAPDDSGGGTELTGNGYARQDVTFGASSGGASTNTGAVTFTASGGNWVTATHFAIWSATSPEQFLAWSPLDTSKQIDDGESMEFAIGALTVSVD